MSITELVKMFTGLSTLVIQPINQNSEENLYSE